MPRKKTIQKKLTDALSVSTHEVITKMFDEADLCGRHSILWWRKDYTGCPLCSMRSKLFEKIEVPTQPVETDFSIPPAIETKE